MSESKREFKKGDRIAATGTVQHVNGKDIGFRPDGADYSQYCVVDHCTLIDPDELQVGDLVKHGHAQQHTIREGLFGYRLNGCHDTSIWSRDELTKIPPEPTSRWEYSDDRLFVYLTQPESSPDTVLVGSIGMSSSPDNVERFIANAAAHYGINADEARKLIAVPTVIETKAYNPTISFAAIRYATGWTVRAVSIYEDRRVTVEESVARAMFPTIGGPYLTETS